MIELLRNCSHGSEYSTYLFCDDHAKSIVKSTVTPGGMRSLECETSGYAWYQSVRYPHLEKAICNVTLRKTSYMRIVIDFIDGRNGSYLGSVEDSEQDIRAVMEHYCDVWPCDKDGRGPLHGDMSLGNIIFNPDGVNLIDWEHFREWGAPWGYDALYLLFDKLKFALRDRAVPAESEMEIVVDNIAYLVRNGSMMSHVWSRPLQFVAEFMRANQHLWAGHIDKFPTLHYSDDQIDEIDSRIHAAIQDKILTA